MIAIVYFAVDMNTVYAWKFFVACGIAVLTYWYGTAYGLLISTFVPKLEIAMALVPILIIPLMVLGGYFLN